MAAIRNNLNFRFSVRDLKKGMGQYNLLLLMLNADLQDKFYINTLEDCVESIGFRIIIKNNEKNSSPI